MPVNGVGLFIVYLTKPLRQKRHDGAEILRMWQYVSLEFFSLSLDGLMDVDLTRIQLDISLWEIIILVSHVFDADNMDSHSHTLVARAQRYRRFGEFSKTITDEQSQASPLMATSHQAACASRPSFYSQSRRPFTSCK